MPLYEYTCQDCGHTTDALRNANDADKPIACESCAGASTQRAHSTFNTAPGATRSPSQLPTSPGCGCGNPHGPCGR